MGVFSIPVRVKLGGGVQETDVGVDTGSLYTVFPGELLERLGVERRYPNIDFSAADNRILPRDVGLAWIEIDGEWVDELVGDRWVPMTGRVLESPLFVVFGHDENSAFSNFSNSADQFLAGYFLISQFGFNLL